VRLALRNFRNKSGFHECPRCKSRSCWKADPQNTLEATLHRVLRVSPYRCARCDMRFMDAKAKLEKPPTRVGRWWASVRSRAARALTISRPSPFDDSLKLHSFLPSGVQIKHEGAVGDSVPTLTKAS
jgi:DNA-directed RNA polymerase subunit RPC12/RpoP